MGKLDLKKSLGMLYQPKPKVVTEVLVPPLQYLMVDGQGDPEGSPAHDAAVEALLALSYALRFMVKTGPAALDYGVMPLEGLWYSDGGLPLGVHRRDDWRWTMMIMQPEVVTPELLAQAVEGVLSRRSHPAWATLRLERLEEGRCAQTLHVGPLINEGTSLARLHEYIAGRGQPRGRHHEVYLSDVRKAAPSRLRTILRQPLA